jgi:uncharacterized protein
MTKRLVIKLLGDDNRWVSLRFGRQPGAIRAAHHGRYQMQHTLRVLRQARAVPLLPIAEPAPRLPGGMPLYMMPGESAKDGAGVAEVTVREAGRNGGQSTSSSHGTEFYKDIGHKGGQKGGQRVRELIDEGKQSEQ